MTHSDLGIRVGVAFSHQLSEHPENLGEIARAIEDLGFEHVLMYDHPVLPALATTESRYSAEDAFFDPMMAMSYIAGVTQRIELITGVLVLPQRQTALVARQAADVSLLSRGRFGLGVGVGWTRAEYDALGADFDARGTRLEQQVDVLRQLWSGVPVRAQVGREAFNDVVLNPVPRRAIPIFVGGSADVALRRAARIADGFIFAFGFRDEALEKWRRMQELLAERENDAQGFRSMFNLHVDRTEEVSPATVVTRIHELRDAGGTDVSVPMIANSPLHVGMHIDFLAEVSSLLEAA